MIHPKTADLVAKLIESPDELEDLNFTTARFEVSITLRGRDAAPIGGSVWSATTDDETELQTAYMRYLDATDKDKAYDVRRGKIKIDISVSPLDLPRLLV